ncbi:MULTISPECIES: ATP-dependent Clp protease proteolytic subunit [Streptomycetaceae]|uniref:ATP-dependent Clp protease proteolytic subunit n=1 Tax=Streptantibioticus cattleyicolor (strain ATCC 35852 / DSM 46488 / JCM 4925 / NBRC 14057 / NRRL 8057) TaxID=1003195 RepID=F8JPN4_STREN|nr:MULTISPECIES: ATP-dependent Clp protease proteolytic subunit [Streptomycetaceae]AEW92726.1 ATP-dependent Clp protease proteolytic subunit 2 [Streptantibioticus cattleyicolor NRRL 8057 = DSM 46488]MYS57492.1 ATP-dependent Clp protease proteolytic subunit [Streptomyces sp. SID5468]CCB73080.1 ATP-dependent Clp protease proteolytic subunit 5 [Streptantibioticus cattleyicolor NRRL 8057 = DSM 46488]
MRQPSAVPPAPTARYVLPEFTERTSQGLLAMNPYGKLLSERVIFLGTPVDDTAANDVMAQLVHLEYASPDQDIQLYINSPGGSFTAMTAVYDTMRYISCDIQTVCLGQAVAAAALLLAAGTPGKRLALPGARIVLEQPAIPEPVQGTTADLEIQAAEMERRRTRTAELLAEHTGRPIERIQADIERATVLDGPGARAYGLVDHLTRSRKAPAAPGPR